MADFDINDIPAPLQFLITGLVCGAVIYFAYMLDFSNLHRLINSNHSKEEDLKTQLIGSFSNEAQLNAELNQFSQLETILKKWQNSLIKASELPDLLNEILKIGTSNNLHFELFTPGAKSKDGNYIKIPIKTVVTGNYDQIATFISQIANMNWIIGIANFTIQQKNLSPIKSDQPEPKGILLAQFTFEVYYLAEK